MTSGLPASLDEEGRTLRRHLGAVMARGMNRTLDEADFNGLALRVFRFQTRAVPVYGSFVRGRGMDPETVDHWSRIPAVPARAFGEIGLVAGDPETVEAVFRTSGTTRTGGDRGTHRVRDLSLYRDALLPNARAYLNPGGERLRVLALLPSPEARPDSSLVYMGGVLMEAWDDGGGAFLVDGQWHLLEEALVQALTRAADDGSPVLLLGTAFAFVHTLDHLQTVGARFRLPPGSRVMETGGFKGRSREVSRPGLYAGITERLGVPGNRIVNEYGMTELLSQFYEPVLPQRSGRQRFLVGPPSVRTRILDPGTLTPVEEGKAGLLCHFDLANLYSVSAVLTEDLGRRRGPGFQVLGRNPGAEPRGCSLAMEDLLRSRAEAGK